MLSLASCGEARLALTSCGEARLALASYCETRLPLASYCETRLPLVIDLNCYFNVTDGELIPFANDTLVDMTVSFLFFFFIANRSDINWLDTTELKLFFYNPKF